MIVLIMSIKKQKRFSRLPADELLMKKIGEHRLKWKAINEREFPIVGFYFEQIHKSDKKNGLVSLYTRKDGEKLFLAVDSAQIYDEKGELLNTIYSFSDITELMTAQEKVNYLAYYDELTGLPNRYYIKERLEEVLSEISHFEDVALLLINLNRFRVVNDSLGNDVGDAFIAIIAERLDHLCKPLQLR